METHVWLTTIGPGTYMQRIEPVDRPGAAVTVRKAAGVIPYDGVWIDGQRSYDTSVLVDGEKLYQAPRTGLADTSFDLHEQAGGGHAP